MTKLEAQRPQLISEGELKSYLLHDSWALSQKLDGTRVLVQCGGNEVSAFSRDGNPRDLPAKVADKLTIKNKFLFDGELIDDTYWVFDILETPLGDIRNNSWMDRQTLVNTLITEELMSPSVCRVQQIFGYEAKLEFYEQCQASAEGVIFSSTIAPYRPGKSKNVLKFKFISEVDCVIIGEKYGGKDNFTLAVYKDGEEYECGRVSALTGDGPSLKVGDVVAVRCLYSTDAGRLFHPTTPRLRTDKTPEQCTFDQIEAITLNKKVIQNG